MRILRLAPARRILLVLWGGWTIAALGAAALYLFYHEVGLVLAALLLLVCMIVLTGIEYNFRRRSLPPEARRPWHAILVFPVVLVPSLMMVVGKQYAHYLPGSQARSEDCMLRITRLNNAEHGLNFSFRYQWTKKNWGPRVIRKNYSETRIWIQDREKDPWVLDPNLKTARPDKRTDESILLNPEGYESLVRQLAPKEISPTQLARTAITLRDTLGLRTTNTVSVSDPTYRFFSDSDDITPRNPWWPWLVAIVFSASLFPVTAFVVSNTMFPRALHG